MSGLAFELRQCAAHLGRHEVFQRLDLRIRPACWTSIVGPNGAGKSTLLKAMAGLLPVTGLVLLNGQDLRLLPARERARALAWLGQNESAADDLSVYDLAMLGRMPHQSALAPPSAEDHAIVRAALVTTQAWDWRERPLGELSGGERQRVLIARALSTRAGVLLMDEPLANLDAPHQADWLVMVRQLVAAGTTVVSVLHEINMALQADEMVVMAKGHVLHHGPSRDAATHAALTLVFDERITIHHLHDQWIALPR